MPCAAVGTSGSSVGIDTNHLGFRMLDVILTCSRSAGVDRGNTRSHTHRVSSDIGNDARSESQDPPIAQGRELGVLNLVASMGRREKALAASLQPPAWEPSAEGQNSANNIFGVKTELGSESATDIGSNEPQFVEREAETLTQKSCVGVGQ